MQYKKKPNDCLNIAKLNFLYLYNAVNVKLRLHSLYNSFDYIEPNTINM